MVPVVAALAAQLPVPISVDTTKAAVARAAIDAGAVILNDVSGLRHDARRWRPSPQSAGVALVLMHMRGTTADMYRQASYVDVATEVAAELAWSVQAAAAPACLAEALVDRSGARFRQAGRRIAGRSWPASRTPHCSRWTCRMLVGASRKSFLQAAVGERPARERDPASAAAATVAALSGAHIVRVHDVPGSVQAVRVADMISAAAESGMS